MIVLVAALCGACLLVGAVIGVLLERAATRRQRRHVDVTYFGTAGKTSTVGLGDLGDDAA